MPSHYDELPESRERTSGLGPEDIDLLLEAGEITKPEARELHRMYKELAEQAESQTVRRSSAPVPRKRPNVGANDAYPPPPRRKPKPLKMGQTTKATGLKAHGGMVKSKPRTGHVDYRKGGMVYNIKVKRG